MKLTPFIYTIMIIALTCTSVAFADGDNGESDDSGGGDVDTALIIKSPSSDFSNAYLQEINKGKSQESLSHQDEEIYHRQFESKTSRM